MELAKFRERSEIGFKINRKIMDLLQKVNSKKNVDFNDTRYQLVDKLKPTMTKNIRQTFTVYDNRDDKEVNVLEIAAAYELSDKKVPIGELLTKMTDYIMDLADGNLDSEDDAVRAWKYSRALLIIYADKKKRGESLTVFDNSLKNAVINCPVFQEKYPGKYTLQTNFFDPKIIQGLIDDIVTTFEEDTVPKIHVAAIKQSRENAESHRNQTLDKIIVWAQEKYGCTVQPYYDINEDPNTGLKYATNTVILHLKNGYDMSIVGYTGTDHDNQFSVSIFDSNDLKINFSTDKCSPEELRKKLVEASGMDAVAPITKMIKVEEARNKILMEQYSILKEIKPMIPESILKLPVAESIVGQEYIWGCEQFRLTHNDLPEDFTLDQVQLPVFDESMIIDDSANAVGEILNEITSAEQKDEKINGVFVRMNAGENVVIPTDEPESSQKSDIARSTLLPGFVPVKKEEKPSGPSITQNANIAPEQKKPIFADKPPVTKLPQQPAQNSAEIKPKVAPAAPAEQSIKSTRLPFSPTPAAPAQNTQPVEQQAMPTKLPTMPQPAPVQPKQSPQPEHKQSVSVEDMFA